MDGRRLLRWSLALAVPALVLLLHGQGLLQQLGLMGYDLLFELRGGRPPDGRVVIVAQDDATLDHYGIRLSDWPRGWHARLIRRLDAAGAELVVFDYDFSRPSDPGEDRALAAAIEGAGNVILTNHLRADGRVSGPLPMFARHSLGEGFINTALDADGHWRRMPYVAVDARGYLRFSLPLTVVEVYENFPLEQRLFDRVDYLGWGRHELPYPDLRINFRGPGGTLPTLSYQTVLEDSFDPERVRDAIVLVGNTHRLGKDFFPAPMDPRMPAVEIHANAIASVLHDDFIRAVDPRILQGLVVVAGLLGGIASFLPRIGLAASVAVAGGTVVAVLAGAYLLFAAAYIWLDPVPVLLAAIAGAAVAGAGQWQRARRRAARIRSVFGRYVSRNVVDVILARDTPVELAGHRAEVTVLFSDIRGFTGLSERLPPDAVGRFLNRYFDEMIACVFDHGGTLDKLMGDAVMAFFGAPLAVADHPVAACRCALAMGRRLEAIKAGGIVPEGVELEIGVGINSGEVIAGNLGSERFIDYTVIGDNVNLASRLEGLNKRYGTRIVISEATREAVGDALPCRELDTVRVKGKEQPTRIFEVLDPDRRDAAMSAALDAYARGLARYRRGDWESACGLLEEALRHRPEDGPARALLARCREWQGMPPPEGWTGVTVLDAK